MTENQAPLFDACIPYHPKDEPLLEYTVESLHRNAVGLRNVYLISKEEPEDLDVSYIWIPESSFPFAWSDVATLIPSKERRVGWYYQQLLKLYANRTIPGILPKVLLWDSDMVLLRRMEFLDASGVLLLDYNTDQHHEPYFKHFEQLFEGTVPVFHPAVSGIQDHMLVDGECLEAMLTEIERRHGVPAWRRILELVDPASYDFSGFSEYETIFNYMLYHYKDRVRLRKAQHFRGSSFQDLGRKDVDMLVLHSWVLGNST